MTDEADKLVEQLLPCECHPEFVARLERHETACVAHYRETVAEGIRKVIQERDRAERILGDLLNIVDNTCDPLWGDSTAAARIRLGRFIRGRVSENPGNTQSAQIAALSERGKFLQWQVDRLRPALEQARDTFLRYGDLHKAKPDMEKAQRDYDLAALMDLALATDNHQAPDGKWSWETMQDAEIAALRSEVERLRTDLSHAEPVAHCEGCQAPLFDGDDFVSSEDCSGCWHTMTDAPTKRDRPCFAYRVGKPEARKARITLGQDGDHG